ncbi:MAG: T9SS type A sorting domain-containing protein [Saprospiraceae bacterium]
MKRLTILISILCLCAININSQNIYDARQSVILEANIFENPPRIKLNWVLDTINGGYTIWRKSKYDVNWGDSVAILGPDMTSWVDTAVAVGIGYEYQVLKSLPAFTYEIGKKNFGSGYIYCGIKLPPIHHRGNCLIAIDSTFSQSLAPEILRLISDLESDGWNAQSVIIGRNDPIAKVKSFIVSWAENNKNQNLTLFLLGRIPIPYSGDIAPDGHHSDHRGAWPCDGYYGNLDGIWTDSLINNKTAADRRNQNIPGDGKFDNIVFPTPVKIQIGRVDFAKMTKFSESEEQLLRRYLNKDHIWRTGGLNIQERGLVDNNFPSSLEGLGQSGWKNFSTMFGYSKVKDLQYRQTLTNQSYLWSYGCGGGGPESASDISSTTYFTTDSLQTIFTLLFGSYFGDWDYPNDFLRGAIASKTCLTSTWANRPNWLFHHMALGEHIGYSTQLTMNNFGLYFPPFYGAYVHTALLGDPTLRMHILKPIENLSAVQSEKNIKIEWQDPAHALGYFIYKKTAKDSTYILLNSIPVTNKIYIDSCAGFGQISYRVRSMELRTSASGSYYNLSSGVDVSIFNDPNSYVTKADLIPSLFFDKLTVKNTSLNSKSFYWTFGDGGESTEFQPDHLYTLNGEYKLCLTAYDACNSDTSCHVLTITSSLPQVSAMIDDAKCFGTATGSIALQTAGGTPMLKFNWSNLPDTISQINNILAGTYFCTITSETNNRAVHGPFIVKQPTAWIINETIAMSDPGKSNGSVSINPQGGCPPYIFKWSTGQTTSGIQDLDPGLYCVTITDCKTCSQEYCATIKFKTSIQELPSLVSYKLLPNPTYETLSLELEFEDSQELQLCIFDANGKRISNQKCQGKDIQLSWDVRTLTNGLYWIHIQSARGYAIIPFTKA